ncbi:hypothetical protein I7I48_05095 [Histoplasma ohiense]|nr:hypothetical protein I7I48_05095 [Histoplasma ohiense (nom. inval.)]
MMAAVTRTALITALTLIALLNKSFSAAEELPSWFNGYYIFPANGTTSVESITCRDSNTAWVTSGTYANCCANTMTTPCPMPTKCQDASVTFNNGGGYACPPRQSCATMTIYETSPGGSPSATNIFCWENWSAYTVYRKLPPEVSETSKPQTQDSTQPTQSNQRTKPNEPNQPNQPTANPQDSASLPSPTSLPNAPPEKSKSNAGVIAGATIGGIAGVSILALAFFFYRRKQKKGDRIPVGAAELDNSHARAELQSLHRGVGGGIPKGQGYYGYAAGGAMDDGANSDPRQNYVHELPVMMKDSSGYGGSGGSPVKSNARRRDNFTYEMPTGTG